MLFHSKWITYTTGAPKSADDKYGNPAPYFRKTFTLTKKPQKATLLISALGVFKAYLNGQPVSNDYFAPGWVDYSKQLPLVRYDLTDRLEEKNALGIVLGDGWAVGHIGSHDTFKRNNYNDIIEFTALLRLEYEDGTVEEIPTDETWRAAQGEIRRTDNYMGEYIDARLSLGNFSAVDYDDAAWDFAEDVPWKFSRSNYLNDVVNPPVVVKHVLKPVLVRKTGNTYMYDVTQNIAGVLRCVLQGTRGTKVVFRHGERLQADGSLFTTNLQKAEATDTFILAGTGEEVFRPLFTFHGFQYAEITVYGQAEIKDITAEVMYTDLEPAGEFSCSHPIVTKIYQNALWGQRDNFLDVPTDCPQRDERLGWTADTQVFCKSAMYNMDCRVFYQKYMMDVRDAQLGNGVVPAVAPLPHPGYRDYVGYDCAAGWADAVGEIPYFHYMMYGDKKIIRDNLYALKRQLDFYEYESPDGIRRNNIGYGDWLNWCAVTDISVISTLFYARSAYDCAELCHVVGDYEEERYRALYEHVKAAFRKEFVDEIGKIFSDTQTCYIVAYQFGIITAEEAKRNLARKLREDDRKLSSGFLGIKHLLPTLCDLGMQDDAYHIICSTQFPGWGYAVAHGATTIWERWHSYTDEHGIKPGSNSFNHYAFGSCTEWMYEYCLGIRPHFEKPGFQKVTFRPYMDRSGLMTSAQGYHHTDFGTISVNWKLEDGVYTYTVTVPDAIEAEFDFPGLKQLDCTKDGETHVFRLTAQ